MRWLPTWTAPTPTPGRNTRTPTPSCMRHPARGEPVQARRGDLRALQRPGAGPGADDGRLRHRLHQHADRRARPPAHLRGVLAGDDRVHPRTDPRAQRAGARVRGARPLVLRGAVLHQPVVLDRRHSVGIRGQRAGQQLAGAQHRRDDLQSARAARQDLESLRRRTGPVLRHRPDPLPAAQGPVRHPLRAVRPVRGRRRRQGPARLLLHRAVPDPGPRGLPPRPSPAPWATASCSPASTRRPRSWAARRS